MILLSLFPLVLVFGFPKTRPDLVFSLLLGWLFYVSIWDFVNVGIVENVLRQVLKMASQMALLLGAAWRGRRFKVCS